MTKDQNILHGNTLPQKKERKNELKGKEAEV